MAVRDGLERQARGTTCRVSYALELIRGCKGSSSERLLAAEEKKWSGPMPAERPRKEESPREGPQGSL